MDDREVKWIAVIDDRGARLFRARMAGKGRSLRPRLALVGTLENPLTELDRSARHSAAYEDSMDRRSELRARYAVDLVKWMEDNIKKKDIPSLDVLTPVLLETLLQAMYAQSIAGSIRHHRVDLGRLSPTELERSPHVLELFEETREDNSRRAS